MTGHNLTGVGFVIGKREMPTSPCAVPISEQTNESYRFPP
jgi:hypothetical protein